MSWIKQFRSVFWRSWLTFNRDVVIFRVRLYQSIVRATDIISRWLRFMFFLSYGQQTLKWLPYRLLKRQTVLLRPPGRSYSTYLWNDSWVQTVHWSKLVLNSGKILPTFSSFKTGWLRSSSCNNVGGNKCRLSTICAVFSIRVKVSGTSTINAILHKRRYFFAFFELAKASAKWARCATHAGRGNGQKKITPDHTPCALFVPILKA